MENTMPAKDQSRLAVKAARLYYYQDLTTEEIARELSVSRPTVSRLLTFARQNGLVEIRIHDPEGRPQQLEQQIQARFELKSVKVVSVPLNSREDVWLERVAGHAANHLNSLIHSDMTVGIAWGNTLEAVSKALSPKHCARVEIVQLNGSGTNQMAVDGHISDIYSRFAANYGAQAYFFPVPAFFDFPETKVAMFRERLIEGWQKMISKADLLVYSIGSEVASPPSYVYSGEYLDARDFQELKEQRVVGDIATVFFREDGTFDGIPLNDRASGPDLTLFQKAKHGLCVVSGLGKARGLRAALRGRLMTELIVDEPTAHAILQEDNT
ncbi:MAG TPA: sugar-binding transcriptional regulator [Terrimicrobium sp.]